MFTLCACGARSEIDAVRRGQHPVGGDEGAAAPGGTLNKKGALEMRPFRGATGGGASRRDFRRNGGGAQKDHARGRNWRHC
jgi:hypothetical protein